MASVDNDVLADVGRALVASLAPQEVPLFRPVSEAFFKNPQGARSSDRDDILGFGAAEVTLITPAVLTVLTHVGMFLAEVITAHLIQVTASKIKEQVHCLLRGEHSAVALQPAQLLKVRQIAFDTAKDFRLADAKATQLADAVVGRLAVDRRL